MTAYDAVWKKTDPTDASSRGLMMIVAEKPA